MKVQFNLEVTKFRAIVIVLAVVLVGAGLVVQAQSALPPSAFGHTTDQIDWTQPIPELTVAGASDLQGVSATTVAVSGTASANNLNVANTINAQTVNANLNGQVVGNGVSILNGGVLQLQSSAAGYHRIGITKTDETETCANQCNQAYTNAVCIAAFYEWNSAPVSCTQTLTPVASSIATCVCVDKIE